MERIVTATVMTVVCGATAAIAASSARSAGASNAAAGSSSSSALAGRACSAARAAQARATRPTLHPRRDCSMLHSDEKHLKRIKETAKTEAQNVTEKTRIYKNKTP